MNIKEKLKLDLTDALKNHEKLKVSTLRSVIGAIQTQEKSGKTAEDFNDEQVLQVLSKEAKKRLDTSEEYAKLGHMDRAETERNEATIIQAYLPEQTTLEEIKVAVQLIVDSMQEPPTQKDMGLLMKQAKEKFGSTADGKTLSDVVRSFIS